MIKLRSLWAAIVLACTSFPVISGQACNSSAPTRCGANCHCSVRESCGTAACGGSACKSGFNGITCQTLCADRTFGFNCDYTCNCADTNEICNKVTGACTSGCKTNYYGEHCLTECLPSVTKCGLECHCLNDDNCGNTCNGECDQGWTGTECQTPDTTPCSVGKYGPSCQQNCTCQNYQSATCDKISGACSGPCKDGFHSSACAARCPCQNHQSITCNQMTGICSGPCKSGYWGIDCLFNCNCPNRKSTTCNKDSGVCATSCNTGFTGPSCQPATTIPTTCTDGLYGRLCNQNCNCPLHTSTACDRMNGTCTGVECQTQLYGTNCDQVCNCPNRETAACDRLSGRCTSPCSNGLTTPDCETVPTTPTTCPEGKYGTQCKKMCDCPKRVTPACDRLNGECTSPCINGLTAQNCETETTTCPDGKYGSNCEGDCSCPNRLTDACNRTTGVCTSDCSAEFTGSNCQQTLSTRAQPATKTADALTGPVMGAIIGGVVLAVVVIVVVIVLLVRRRRHVPTATTGTIEGTRPIVTAKKPKGKQGSRKDIQLLELVDIVQSLDADPEFLDDEFKALPGGVAMSSDTAYLPQHVHKCRYKGMVPYDHSRVVLEPSDSDPYSDFINASYIDGFSMQKKYVAAQGTTTFIMNDFWRMVWQLNADVVVMLTQLKEGNKIKCDQYWPEEVSIAYGHITVELLVTHQFDDFLVRTLTVRAEGKVRTIKQFHFTHWGDHDAPEDTSGIISLLSRVQEAKDEAKGPIVVHCSAGVGRTGTYIALEMLLEEGYSRGVVDIPKCVTTIRKQRANMIQTPTQYAFLHRALRDAWVGADSILTPPEFALKAGTYFHAIPPADKSKAETEFEGLHYLRKILGPDDYKDARNSKNQDKNRDDDNLPPDSSRLFLSTYIPGRNDYINAVYLPGYKSKFSYVSTQTPLPDTVIDFWRLVHEQKASTILMLNTDEIDNDGWYWPDDDESLTLGPFEIRHQGTETNGDILQRQFGLIYTKSGEEVPQVVRQFSMNMWNPSENVPNSFSVLTLLKSVSEWQRQHGNRPIIVHCRNGVDRTVLLCACFSVIEKLTAEQIISVMYTVKTMRKHRPGAIATLDQYRFIYQVVRQYIDTFSTYSNFCP